MITEMLAKTSKTRIMIVESFKQIAFHFASRSGFAGVMPVSCKGIEQPR